MTEYLMLDDVNLALLARFAGRAHAVAGYVNGRYANWSQVMKTYGATHFLLSIDVKGNPRAGAQALDIESGDAVIALAPGWTKATRAAGLKARDFRWLPKLYTSEDNLPALVKAMDHAGVKRSDYLIWSAHYTGKPHICGPATCGSTVQADATQWTDAYEGISLDASLCSERFFAPCPPVKPKPRFRRHIADGTKSLDAEAAALHATLRTVLTASATHLSTRNLRRLVAYLASGPSAKAPKGLVFWTETE